MREMKGIHRTHQHHAVLVRYNLARGSVMMVQVSVIAQFIITSYILILILLPPYIGCYSLHLCLCSCSLLSCALLVKTYPYPM